MQNNHYRLTVSCHVMHNANYATVIPITKQHYDNFCMVTRLHRCYLNNQDAFNKQFISAIVLE